MKKINFLLALFMLISVSFNSALAADNNKLHPYGDADSDASLLVNAGTYTDTQTAQIAIFPLKWRAGSTGETAELTNLRGEKLG